MNAPSEGGPKSADWAIFHARRYAGANRFMYPTTTGTPVRSLSAASSTASAELAAPGLSQKTGFPASRQSATSAA